MEAERQGAMPPAVKNAILIDGRNWAGGGDFSGRTFQRFDAMSSRPGPVPVGKFPLEKVERFSQVHVLSGEGGAYLSYCFNKFRHSAESFLQFES